MGRQERPENGHLSRKEGQQQKITEDLSQLNDHLFDYYAIAENLERRTSLTPHFLTYSSAMAEKIGKNDPILVYGPLRFRKERKYLSPFIEPEVIPILSPHIELYFPEGHLITIDARTEFDRYYKSLLTILDEQKGEKFLQHVFTTAREDSMQERKEHGPGSIDLLYTSDQTQVRLRTITDLGQHLTVDRMERIIRILESRTGQSQMSSDEKAKWEGSHNTLSVFLLNTTDLTETRKDIESTFKQTVRDIYSVYESDKGRDPHDKTLHYVPENITDHLDPRTPVLDMRSGEVTFNERITLDRFDYTNVRPFFYHLRTLIPSARN